MASISSDSHSNQISKPGDNLIFTLPVTGSVCDGPDVQSDIVRSDAVA